MLKIPQLAPNVETALSVAAYSFCSGTLVLLNKLILHQLPYPSLVISFQLCAALAFIFGAKLTGLLEVDPLKWKFIFPYLFYTVAFSLGVYCNMRSLNQSNVETVIVFRALSPCVVAVLDAMFLGREYPSPRSWGAIGLIVLGAYGYASYDEKFQTQGMSAYFWPLAYMCIISFEMAYGKKIIRSVDLKTKSGPVLYTNLLGLPPMLVFASMGKEYSKIRGDFFDPQSTTSFPSASIPLLIMGCVAGTGIGYSSWWCRDKVSATSFTIIGVMNKCLTILLNLMVWDKHAPPMGIMFLLLCLVGGTVYKQAPMRQVKAQKAAAATVAAGNDDVWEIREDMTEPSPSMEVDEEYSELLHKRNKAAGSQD